MTDLLLKINLVPRTRIELVMTGYQPIVIPFNYPGKLAEVVGFEPTDPFEPSVFKTAALSHAQPYFLNLEQRVRFELTILRICNPLHWTSLPPLHCLVPAEGIEPSQER